MSLELWFDFASTYSYIGALRVEALAARAGVQVAWRPFLLGPIFAQQGLKDSPFNVNPARGRYMWRDLERQCAKYGLAWKKPSVFPRNSVLAGRVACLGQDAPWGPSFVRAVFEASFAHDQDISDRAVIARLLEQVGPGPAAIDAALAPEHKERLRKNTETAIARGVFGAPSVFVGDELFFGQDRLEDAIAFARPTSPRTSP